LTGYPYSAVRNACRELGLATAPSTPRRSAAEIAKRRTRVEKLYAIQGIRAIAVELGISQLTVWKDVQFLGLEMRKPGRKATYPDGGPRQCAYPECGNWFHPKPS